MFGSDILEVSIGLALVFALVSTICTTVREGIESFLKTRASYLEYGIRQLLNDPHANGVAKDIFDHPLISGLYVGTFVKAGEVQPPANSAENQAAKVDPPKRKLNAQNKNWPSYIPAKNFAKALIDVVARGPVGDVAADASSQPITLARLRGNLAHMDNPHLQRAILSALDSAEGDVNRLRTNLEAWYDSAMDRVSGWYKRTTQKMLFLIALAIVVSLNVNTITIADYLFRHDAEREALIASIESPTAAGEQPKLTYDEANKKLSEMHLPIGWTEGWGAPRSRNARYGTTNADEYLVWDDVVGPVIGWLLTAFAAMLGAPFWFDLLGKFVTVRSTMKPREEKKDEQTKDDQTGTAATRSGAPATFASIAATAEASADAHAVDDHCGVGTNIVATPDDRLPAAIGGVA